VTLSLPIRRGIRALSLLVLAVVIVACADEAVEHSAQSLQMLAEPTAGAAPPIADFSGRGVALGTAGGSRPERDLSKAANAAQSIRVPTSLQGQTAVAGMIIRNGDVSVEVDSLETGIERVRQLAASLGGFIGNVSANTGERQVRSASLEMKIPSARFDDAMAGMAPLGKVERSTATAEDVGEEFVDISARVANAKRLEARLIALLATRTGKLEDVLAVERELARVREEIERYEGRIRYLSSRVAISTIVATVHEKAPLIASQPGTNVIGQAFINMWRNFVSFVALGIEALGVALPLAALAWLLLWRWKRWRANRVTVAA
jgi:hypothetical protein